MSTLIDSGGILSSTWLMLNLVLWNCSVSACYHRSN